MKRLLYVGLISVILLTACGQTSPQASGVARDEIVTVYKSAT